jgi:hypothetical protein
MTMTSGADSDSVPTYVRTTHRAVECARWRMTRIKHPKSDVIHFRSKEISFEVLWLDTDKRAAERFLQCFESIADAPCEAPIAEGTVTAEIVLRVDVDGHFALTRGSRSVGVVHVSQVGPVCGAHLYVNSEDREAFVKGYRALVAADVREERLPL